MFPCRCFLSAGSLPSCPSRSWVVEALCIPLCEKHAQPRRKPDSQGWRTYTSRCVHVYMYTEAQQTKLFFRWKLVISVYNSVKAHLYNSQALLEGTNLCLYTIDEATLASTCTQWCICNCPPILDHALSQVRWCKNASRREEIKMLL